MLGLRFRSTDPFFVEGVWDIVGPYLSPPDRALVLCVDDKGQCQAREPTQPALPTGLSYVGGTTTQFVALKAVCANGIVLAQCKPKHRYQEFLACLRHIAANVPARLDVHLICDNYYGIHKVPPGQGLGGAPPPLSSAFHAHLQSLAELGRALLRIDYYPGHPARHLGLSRGPQVQERYVRETLQPAPRPFRWIAIPESILGKLERPCEPINGAKRKFRLKLGGSDVEII